MLRRIGGGRRYEAMLVWDEHRLAVLVAKVLRPDQATEPAALRDLAARGRAARRGSPTRSSCAASARCSTAASRTCVLEHLEGPTLDEPPAPLRPAHDRADGAPGHYSSAPPPHYLNAEGVAHLDIKPSNIIIGRPPRLIDLSVARTHAGVRRS